MLAWVFADARVPLYAEERVYNVVRLCDVLIPFFNTSFHCRKRRHHSKDVTPHKRATEHLNFFNAKLPSSQVTDHLRRAEYSVGVLLSLIHISEPTRPY